MDMNKNQKGDGNEKNLKNAERDKVTGIKTSDLRKNDKSDKPVTADEQAAKGKARQQSAGRNA
jgi:hypothetical protein